nr:putative nuclease HARBI1 isoform X2 [Hydra vulgaris]
MIFQILKCRRKFRLPLHKISEIINTLKIDLSPKTDKNNPISPETKVLVALRFLATGSFQNTIEKGYSAINCKFVVDPDGQFRDAVIKFPGSCHDVFVYSNSTLKQTLELDPASGFLFGDSGYGLSPVMITPFSPALNPEEILFNKIHSRVRSEIERCFGRLKNRWRCLHKNGGTLQYTPSKCCSIIYTCVILGIIRRNNLKSYMFANRHRYVS